MALEVCGFEILESYFGGYVFSAQEQSFWLRII